MKEIIEVLRQELILCSRILELSKLQQKILVRNEADEARSIAAKIEPLLSNLGKVEESKRQLLRQQQCDTIVDLLAKSYRNAEREMAIRLLEKLDKDMQELKAISAQNQSLLRRNMGYIDFSINVITQTAAGTTYASSGGQSAEPSSGMKMFDTNI